MFTPTWKKQLIIAFGFLENLIFTGNILGWSALSQMLKDEGIYEDLCQKSVNDDILEITRNVSIIHYFPAEIFDEIDRIESPMMDFSKNNECIEQDKVLNLAYTIGAFFNGFTAFIWGFLLDKWGLRIVRLIINSFLTIGSIMLCLLNKDRSYLVFPAITLLCLGGIPLRIANMQFANLYPKYRSSIIALYSGAFSASAITFVILKHLFDNGLSFFWSCFVLVALSLLMIAFTFSLLPKDKVSEHSASESKEVLTFKKNGTVCGRNLAELSPVTLEKFTPFSSSFRKALHSNYNSEKSSRFTSSRNSVDLSEKELPLRYSLYTLPYLLHQWWYSWLITYMIMYVGSMNLWLKRITTDNKTAASFIQIYGTVQVLSLVIAPIAGLIMDREVNKADDELDPKVRKLKKIKSGFWPMMFTTTCVTAILFARFFDNKAAVYASIVLITLFRSFLIAVSSAFLRIRFPAEHFNRLLGILSTVGACVTLLQFPLFVWEAKAAENVLWVNLFNLICTLIAYLNPLHLVIKPLQEYLIAKESKTNE